MKLIMMATKSKDIDDPIHTINVEGFCNENESNYVECSLSVDGVRLNIKTSQELDNHSDGFKWGYGGSGPAQSALAVLQHVFGNQFALNHVQALKWAVFSKLKCDEPFKIIIETRKVGEDYEFSFKKA
jgi:hypothetical protein